MQDPTCAAATLLRLRQNLPPPTDPRYTHWQVLSLFLSPHLSISFTFSDIFSHVLSSPLPAPAQCALSPPSLASNFTSHKSIPNPRTDNEPKAEARKRKYVLLLFIAHIDILWQHWEGQDSVLSWPAFCYLNKSLKWHNYTAVANTILSFPMSLKIVFPDWAHWVKPILWSYHCMLLKLFGFY